MKRCPFCGSRARAYVDHPKLPNGLRDTLFQVRCLLRECGAMTRWWYPKAAALRQWDRRVF